MGFCFRLEHGAATPTDSALFVEGNGNRRKVFVYTWAAHTGAPLLHWIVTDARAFFPWILKFRPPTHELVPLYGKPGRDWPWKTRHLQVFPYSPKWCTENRCF